MNTTFPIALIRQHFKRWHDTTPERKTVEGGFSAWAYDEREDIRRTLALVVATGKGYRLAPDLKDKVDQLAADVAYSVIEGKKAEIDDEGWHVAAPLPSQGDLEIAAWQWLVDSADDLRWELLAIDDLQ